MQTPPRKDKSCVSGLFRCEESEVITDLTYLHPVGLAEAGADAGSEGTSRHTADHHRHAVLTGEVALQLNLFSQPTVGQVGLVACAVDGETPVVLLTTLGQQSEEERYKLLQIILHAVYFFFVNVNMFPTFQAPMGISSCQNLQT